MWLPMRTRLGRTYTGSPERANAALNAGWFVGASERSAEVVVIAAPLEDVMIVSTSNPAATEATAKKHTVEASAHLREKGIIASERRDWDALCARSEVRACERSGESRRTQSIARVSALPKLLLTGRMEISQRVSTSLHCGVPQVTTSYKRRLRRLPLASRPARKGCSLNASPRAKAPPPNVSRSSEMTRQSTSLV